MPAVRYRLYPNSKQKGLFKQHLINICHQGLADTPRLGGHVKGSLVCQRRDYNESY